MRITTEEASKVVAKLQEEIRTKKVHGPFRRTSFLGDLYLEVDGHTYCISLSSMIREEDPINLARFVERLEDGI